MLYREKTCFLCGPRPQQLPTGYNYNKLEHRLDQSLRQAIRDGYRNFLVNLDMGVALWAGELVVHHRDEHELVRLFCVEPTTEFSADWPLEWRNFFFSVLHAANMVWSLQMAPTPDCIQRSLRVMAELSARLIAVWDGSEKEEQDTAYAVNYARRRGLELDIIDPGDCLGPLEEQP